MSARVLLIVAVFTVAVGGAASAAESRAGRVVVDFARPTGSGGSPAWFVEGVEELVARELSRFQSVELAERLPAACPTRESRCLANAYAAAGVQVIVLGRLDGAKLRYEVWDSWTGTRAFDGSVVVDGVPPATLHRRIGEIVRPIVQRGGLLDQRPALLDEPETPATTNAPGTNAGASATGAAGAGASPSSSGASASPSPAAATPSPATNGTASSAKRPGPSRGAGKGAKSAHLPSPPAPTPPPAASAPPAPPAPPLHDPLPWILIALMLFVASPLGLARLLIRAHQLRQRERPHSWAWTYGVLIALGALLVLSRVVDLRAALAAAAAGKTLGLAIPVAAGMLWGVFVLVNTRWLIAPIHGLGQIRHDVLWPLLRAWLLLTVLRATLLLGFVPLYKLTRYTSQTLLQLPESWTLSVAFPIAGLLVYFWVLTLIDNLSVFLDVQLVIGPATARNPWHGTIRRYFRGYVRRNGIDVDKRLLERTLFLPSLLPNVVSYGGGFARLRVLVGEQTREAALGGLPEENEFPERTVNPEELPWGMVAPTLVPDPQHEEQRLQRAEHERQRRMAAPARGRQPIPRLLGESATLLGWVLPQSADSGIPLIANTSEDFEVVKRLLTEHYAHFERGFDDDEVDDTDPTQKDFLFGALLRELGSITRRDTYFATLWYSLALGARSRFARAVVRAPIALYERFLSGPAATVADAYVGLHHGLHHLIQYLCLIRDSDESKLTARANEPKLIQTSRDLLERVAKDRLSDEEKQLLRATPRHRLLWLSQFFHAPLAPPSHRSARALGVTALVVASALLVAQLVREAIAYHPIYVERMQSQAADDEDETQSEVPPSSPSPGTQGAQGAAPDERPPGR